MVVSRTTCLRLVTLLLLSAAEVWASSASASVSAVSHAIISGASPWLLEFRGGGGGGASRTKDRAGPSIEHEGPLQIFTRTIMDARRHLVAAAAARSSSIFLMFPMDTIKTRIQMEQANPLRLAGIYNGVAGSLVGQVPYGVLTFGSYEMYKRHLLARFPSSKPVFLYAVAAILGDLTGSGWLCPSEVLKQQLQAGMYPSTTAALSGIWKKKGLLGFYEGYLGGVARDVPFRVAQLTSYEVTKNLYLRLKARRQQQLSSSGEKSPTTSRRSLKRDSLPKSNLPLQLTSAEAALCGAVAGTFSAAVTAPLDRIKTLLMTNSAANGGTVLACAAKIWKDEGLRGFSQGLVPRVVYIAPSVVIFFMVYEEVQQRLSHWSSA